ncbi:hypothetical protein MNBD_GAMMA12-1405 [hydrothermal vent metagenome]|uniref:Uncharacterized protein n=1 Tax=hydrothermal vent metagenome TaxID=652676 RepID=A0A3B0YM91_9ZZZZ
MTLGIAAIENNEVFLMADTLLSYSEKSGKKPYHGLKIFFLDKNTAIAYAGTAREVAHGRLHGIYKQGYRGDLKILVDQILNSFDEEVDFLLAQSGRNPAIAEISGGGCLSEKIMEFIGSVVLLLLVLWLMLIIAMCIVYRKA